MKLAMRKDVLDGNLDDFLEAALAAKADKTRPDEI